MPTDLGFEVVACDELVALGPEEYSARVRKRVGEGPLFLSFDIDVLDPAFAPAPEQGGRSLDSRGARLPARSAVCASRATTSSR